MAEFDISQSQDWSTNYNIIIVFWIKIKVIYTYSSHFACFVCGQLVQDLKSNLQKRALDKVHVFKTLCHVDSYTWFEQQTRVLMVL